ncbi:MAG TPA: hypothetical protein VEA79_04435 [Phenylobacterium sp.]|nr:hypothetical protein [Phenylobacterium sp.]
MLSDILTALHLTQPSQQIGMAAVLLTAGYAFWRGGPWERLGGGLMLAGWIATPYLLQLSPAHLDTWTILGVDLAMFLALTAVALVSHRYWPMAVAAFFLLGVLLHLAQLIDPQVALSVRIAATHIFSYLTLVGLWGGMLLEAERDRAAAGEAATR